MNDFDSGAEDPQQQELSWQYVLSRSYGIYAEHFWTYFRIAIIPAFVAYAFSYVEPLATRHLFHGMPIYSMKWAAWAIVIGWIRGAVYWTISAFFFAAIAATFDYAKTGDTQAIADAYTKPRKRLGSLIAIALLTWSLFYIGRALAGFAVAELLEHLGLGRNFWALTSAFGLMLVLIAGLLSRFALSIPEVTCNLSISSQDAIRNSIQATDGWELFFMIFLAKSAALGYCVLWVTSWALTWTWNHWTLNTQSYVALYWAVYICLAAMLESPLFIAFSLLYRELQAHQEKRRELNTPAFQTDGGSGLVES